VRFTVQLPTDHVAQGDEFVSPEAIAEMARAAEQAGFDHHFVKPADLPALQSLLASLPAQRPGA